MRLPDEPETPAQINLVPMIDVIFSILAFFILSTLFLTRSEGLPVNLPQASTAHPQSQTRIVVTIEPDGSMFLNDKSTELDDLAAGVRQLIAENQQGLVIVNADETVSHGRVVTVMDRLRRVEQVRLAIATQKPE